LWALDNEQKNQPLKFDFSVILCLEKQYEGSYSMAEQLDITKDIKVSPDKKTVTISGPSSTVVANSLLKEQQIILEELARIANYPSADDPTTVRLSDVSIDSTGNVVISNASYATALSQILQKGGGMPVEVNFFCL